MAGRGGLRRAHGPGGGVTYCTTTDPTIPELKSVEW
jgi:hypothetical protein